MAASSLGSSKTSLASTEGRSSESLSSTATSQPTLSPRAKKPPINRKVLLPNMKIPPRGLGPLAVVQWEVNLSSIEVDLNPKQFADQNRNLLKIFTGSVWGRVESARL